MAAATSDRGSKDRRGSAAERSGSEPAPTNGEGRPDPEHLPRSSARAREGAQPAESASDRRRRIALLAIAILALAVAAGVLFAVLRSPGRPKEIRIATGTRGGTFLPLGRVLAHGLHEDLRGMRFKALESPGGVASVEMLEQRRADLALISNHVEGSGALRLIAPLYQETLQVVVRRDAAIETPFDLRGKRVSVGPEGSGTETIATEVMTHFGIARAQIEPVHMTLQEAAEALERGEISCAFMVAGMRTPAVDRLLRRRDMMLLSLGDPSEVGSALEGVRLDAPFFEVTTIPRNAYGREPAAPVGTIAVRALLVARADLPEDVVYEITESLFEHKVELATENELLAHLSERFDLALSPYPLHAGADRYYRRDEPTLLKKYADELGLLITIGALIWSAISALAAARRGSRRSRIEHRLGLARALAARARAASDPDELSAVHDELIALREQALEDLEQERLDANDGFRILQDYVSDQIARLERRLGG